jgi:hypothetical protein
MELSTRSCFASFFLFIISIIFTALGWIVYHQIDNTNIYFTFIETFSIINSVMCLLCILLVTNLNCDIMHLFNVLVCFAGFLSNLMWFIWSFYLIFSFTGIQILFGLLILTLVFSFINMGFIHFYNVYTFFRLVLNKKISIYKQLPGKDNLLFSNLIFSLSNSCFNSIS